MTRVLYLIDSLAPGGAERSLVTLIPPLRARGVSIDVAVLHERDGLRADAEKAGARVIPVGGRSRPAKLAGLVRLLRATRPDVLHTTLWEADVLGRVASTVTRTPVVSSLVNINYGPDQLGDATLCARR